MSPIVVIILVVVVLVIVAAIVFGIQASRRRQLQETFGPEYDRVVADTGSRSDGEKELREREKRHAEFELKALSTESKATYSNAWEEIQVDFVDHPEQAVATADDLVTRLIDERGYPTAGYDDQLANLSVDHARTLGHYRDAHAISQRSQKGEASTEDLRQALVHYRALFADLLGADPLTTSPNSTAASLTGSGTTEPADAPAPAPAPDHDTDVAGSRPDASRS
ncbi:MAG: hypothetical protein QOC94_210 [Actinoplanes sp.]|jgi:hypothetical protein|nr:hypothetical protein [Actinoplanes sp.]